MRIPVHIKTTPDIQNSSSSLPFILPKMNMWVGITIIDFISKFDGLFRIWQVWSAWRDGDPPDVLQKKSSTTARQVLNHAPASASPEVKLHFTSMEKPKPITTKRLRPAENCPDGPVPLGYCLLEITAGPEIRRCYRTTWWHQPRRRGGRHLGVSSEALLCCFLLAEDDRWAGSPAVLWAVQDGLVLMGGLRFYQK